MISETATAKSCANISAMEKELADQSSGKRQGIHGIFLLASLLLGQAALLGSCASFTLPKGYVPDDKVVFLREKLEFAPISYKPIPADPYDFPKDTSAIQPESPAFASLLSFEDLLRPDYKADDRLYREVSAHLNYMAALPAYTQLKEKLAAVSAEAPQALPKNLGDKVQDYSNGAQYAYPDAAGATITVLNTGEYKIDYPDKSLFVYFPDGSYENRNPAGQVVAAFYKSSGAVIKTEGDSKFTLQDKERSISSPLGNLDYLPTPEPQYQFSPAGFPAGLKYTFFLKDEGSYSEYSLTNGRGLRFDYELDNQRVSATFGDQAVVVDPKLGKQHEVFDIKTGKTGDTLSLYLPEGLKLGNLRGPGLSYGELQPAWPEGYQTAVVGPFRFLFTEKDRPLIGKLSAQKLGAVVSGDQLITGLSSASNRTIIIPPDLLSYCRLQSDKPGSVLYWYPSGFETKDYIVMWPLSVPRYNAPAGQDYFFNQEFYEIIAHEYVHLMIGENTGIDSPLPAWLNEGYAVFVESHYSADCKAYWDMTFQVAHASHSLLGWDDATIHGTGYFPVAQARTHYAQSYALVGALIARYGAAKVDQYVKSFRVKIEDAGKVDLKADYRTKFKEVFGIEFDEALKLLDAQKGS